MIKNKNVCVSAIYAVNIRIPYRGRESTGVMVMVAHETKRIIII